MRGHGSPLEQAAEYAAILLRSGRHDAFRAIHLAACTHDVDYHELSRLVYERAERNLPLGQRLPDPAPPAALPSLPPAALVQFLVVDIASSAAELIVRARPLVGPFSGQDFGFRLPPDWLGGARAGDRVVCGVRYRQAHDGATVPHLDKFFWIEGNASTLGGGS